MSAGGWGLVAFILTEQDMRGRRGRVAMGMWRPQGLASRRVWKSSVEWMGGAMSLCGEGMLELTFCYKSSVFPKTVIIQHLCSFAFVLSILI